MRIEAVTPEAYQKAIGGAATFFHSVPFHLHNRHKAEDIQFLLFQDGKVRGGIIGDTRSGSFRSPFSAPYGGLEITGSVSYERTVELFTALSDHAIAFRLRAIEIALPPLCYTDQATAEQVLAAKQTGWVINYIDHNQHFDLSAYGGQDQYIQSLPRSARKHIRRAFNSGLDFKVAEGDEEQALAYQVIAQNRQERGFPLRMTEEEVMSTAVLTQAGFFLVYADHRPVAAAIVFEVAAGIVQVIYWGNLEEASGLRPMNYLALRVFDHYHQAGYSLVDIGPSSEAGVPNMGLVGFKESIGCRLSPKFTLSKTIGA